MGSTDALTDHRREGMSMDAGTAAGVVGAAAAAIGLPWGGWVGWRQVRSTTAADQRAAADDIDKQITKARDDERRECEADKQVIRDQLTAMTNDRDYWRSEHGKLRQLIDTRGLKDDR